MYWESAAILFISVLFLLYLYGKRTHGYWKKRGVFYEPPLPIVGNLLDLILLRRNQGQIWENIYKKHPKERVVGVWNFDSPALLVRDPVLVHQVLVTDFYSFPHNEIEVDPEVDPVMANNIFCQRGAKWKRMRQVLSPAFTANKIKSTYSKIQDVTNQLITHIGKHPEELQLKRLMSLFTSEVVARWGLGIDGYSFTTEDPILPKMGAAMFDPTLHNAFVMNFVFLAPSLTKLLNIRMVPKDIYLFFRNMVEEMVQHRRKTGETQADYIQHFIDLQAKQIAKQEEAISDNDMLSGVISFFLESFETSSMVGAFLLYHLAMNQDLQEELRTEINTLPELDLEGLEKLPLLQKCYQETNRMHAALGNMSKVCAERCKLGDVDVEPGTTVMIPLLAIHWDPQYFPEPQKFNPYRFDKDVGEMRKQATFLPFGDGPRICIGMRLASCALKTAVSHILKNYKVVPSERTPPRFEQNPLHFMSNQKGGVYAKFVKI